MGLICFREEVWGPDGEDWHGDGRVPREPREPREPAKPMTQEDVERVVAMNAKKLSEALRSLAHAQTRESFVGDMGQTVYAEDARRG